ncbi:MAG TPA: hypothetical protein VE404_08550, partial [Verrucomicrobiae bacterium]|nr:hypothetical protein [Verrucomicrobiae bacterium]
MRRALVVLAAALVFAGDAIAADGPPAEWTVGYHGYAFLDVNRQESTSTARDFQSENHVMVFASRPWGRGTLQLLGTFTLEPATYRAEGEPELFQRGETYDGILLVDRQHPHDLFTQIAASWRTPLGAGRSFRLYVAPRGEPAIGPVAYPHRLSASLNPSAPLAHHNQDSTHASQDVVTAGFDLSRFTIEASGFHGREPDQNRWDLEQGRIDSYSGRVTYRATPSLSFQVSSARREHPEDLEPGSQTRTTGSGMYERLLPDGFIAVTATVGKDQTPDGQEWGNGVEAAWKFRKKHVVYSRVEGVTRDIFELTDKTQRPSGVSPEKTLVEAATFGYARSIPLLVEAGTELGADVTVYRLTSRLDPVYGDRPFSCHFYLKLSF